MLVINHTMSSKPAKKKYRPSSPQRCPPSLTDSLPVYLCKWCVEYATCSICKRTPPGEWFQCGGGGHALCAHCATCNVYCGICLAEWDADSPPDNPAATFVVNQLNEISPMACANSIHGCKHESTHVRRDHELDCPYRVLECGFDCGWCSSAESDLKGVLAKDVSQHIVDWHMPVAVTNDPLAGFYTCGPFTTQTTDGVNLERISQIAEITVGSVKAWLCWETVDSTSCRVSVRSVRPLSSRVLVATQAADGSWIDYTAVPGLLMGVVKNGGALLPFVARERTTVLDPVAYARVRIVDKTKQRSVAV